MYDFGTQSPKLHAEQDSPEDMLEPNTTTMPNAINAGVLLLEVIQKYGKEPAMLQQILEKEIYPLDYDKNYPNRYAPRVQPKEALEGSKSYARKKIQDAYEATKPYRDKARKIINKYLTIEKKK